jgi:hypothetical protein
MCHIAKTGDDMVSAIEKALFEGSTEARAARCESMKTETWEARVGAITRTVDLVEQRKWQTDEDDLVGAWPIFGDAAPAR